MFRVQSEFSCKRYGGERGETGWKSEKSSGQEVLNRNVQRAVLFCKKTGATVVVLLTENIPACSQVREVAKRDIKRWGLVLIMINGIIGVEVVIYFILRLQAKEV